MREWTEIHRQLQQMLGEPTRKRLLSEPNDFELFKDDTATEQPIDGDDEDRAANVRGRKESGQRDRISNPNYAAIHKSLLTGFYREWPS